jgi:hypothetical protein
MAALCAASICTAAAIWLVRETVARERMERLRAINASIESLTQQISSLSAFNDAELGALRSRVENYQTFLGPESTWNELKERFGDRWSIESGARHDTGKSTNQTGILSLKSPNLEDWQTAVDALGSLKRLAGVNVVRFEMRAAGDYEHRSVEILKVVIETHVVRASSGTSLQ